MKFVIQKEAHRLCVYVILCLFLMTGVKLCYHKRKCGVHTWTFWDQILLGSILVFITKFDTISTDHAAGIMLTYIGTRPQVCKKYQHIITTSYQYKKYHLYYKMWMLTEGFLMNVNVILKYKAILAVKTSQALSKSSCDCFVVFES